MTPFAARLRAALLAGRHAPVRGVGRASQRRGDGYEFAELRGYVEGDDPRRIDWAATARAGGLQTRVMLEESALVLATALDGSGSMQVGRTISNYEAARAAAALWYAAATDDDRCARLGARPLVLPGVRGRAAAAACLAESEPPGASFDGALALALAALPRGARLLVVSDFYELAALEGRLRACTSRFDVTALLAADPWASGLPLGGFVRLRDAEGGRAARAYVDRRARERYRVAVERREAHVVRTLERLGVRVARLRAEAAPETALAAAFALA